jgi:hypothetical protein
MSLRAELAKHRARQRVRPARGSRGHGGLTLPIEASAAQHWSAMCGLEGNRGDGFTFRTRDLSLREAFRALLPFGFTSLAVLWVIRELFLVEENLLPGFEDEVGVAVNAP